MNILYFTIVCFSPDTRCGCNRVKLCFTDTNTRRFNNGFNVQGKNIQTL